MNDSVLVWGGVNVDAGGRAERSRIAATAGPAADPAGWAMPAAGIGAATGPLLAFAVDPAATSMVEIADRIRKE